LFALAACGNSDVHHLDDGGGDGGQTIDAPRGDAALDASAGKVTIAVTVNGGPAPGADVYFQNADNSLVAHVQTGSDGQASEVMAAGGYVTLVQPAAPPGGGGAGLVSPANQNLDTFAGVKPGDVLHIDLGELVAQEPINITVTAPLDPSASAVSYLLGSTCNGGTLIALGAGSGSGSGSGGLAKKLQGKAPKAKPRDLPPTTVQLDGGCATADMLVISVDANGNELDSFFAPAVAVADGATVALTGTYAAVPTQTVTYANVPDGQPAGNTDRAHFVVDSGAVELTQAVDYAATADTQATTFGQPAIAGAVAGLETEFLNTAGQSDQTFAAWGPESTTPISVDYSATRLPDWLSGPTFDVGSQQVQFALTGGGSSSIDYVYTDIDITRAPGDGGIAEWNWDIVAPGAEAGAVQYPILPTDISAFNPAATDTVTPGFTEIGHVLGGYDAIRFNAIDLEPDTELDTTTPSGALVYDDFSAGGADAAVARPSAGRKTHRAHPRARR
jgi:hypothetical protein